MEEHELIVVATFSSRIDADLAQGALQASGIESILSSDDVGGNRPDLAQRGIRLLVRGEDATDAATILNTQA
jgi:hypothetical protein